MKAALTVSVTLMQHPTARCHRFFFFFHDRAKDVQSDCWEQINNYQSMIFLPRENGREEVQICMI